MFEFSWHKNHTSGKFFQVLAIKGYTFQKYVYFKITGDYTHHAGHTWSAGTNALVDADLDDLTIHITPITKASTADANLWVYLADADYDVDGNGGLAWMKSLCTNKAKSCSITEKSASSVNTAEVSSTA